MTDLSKHLERLAAKDPEFDRRLRKADGELELAMGISGVRQTRRLSQRELATRAGMPQSSIGRYELAGRAPSLDSLWRLADALNATFVFGPSFFARVIDNQPGFADDSHLYEIRADAKSPLVPLKPGDGSELAIAA